MKLPHARRIRFAAGLVLGLSVLAPAQAGDAGLVALGAPVPSLEDVLAPLDKEAAFKNGTVALQVVDVRTGQEVFARNAERAMVPASTMKMLTAAAALKTLGPSYRFTTDVYVDGEIDAAGTLQGNLYVQGHGDPTMVIERLWKLVQDVRLQGIDRVDGDVVFDEGFFTADYVLPGWDKKEDLARGPTYFPSVGALSLNYNTVALVVGPGAEVGGEARVRLETAVGDLVEIDNQVTTGQAGSRRWLAIDREVDGERLVFTLKGSVPSDGDHRKHYRTLAEPTAYYVAAWRELARQQGLEVRGKHRRGAVPPTAKLVVQHRSIPLSAVLMEMNKSSNNFVAEQVLRVMGAEMKGLPGTTEKGLEVVREYLDQLGIDRAEYRLVNGSGLSRTSTLRASHLNAVLVDMARDGRVGREFGASLAIAGLDGTLWRRLEDEAGRLRGKTGTIDGVHCLSGYVESADGGTYAFSFLVNDHRGGIAQVRSLHDRFARRMFAVGAADDDGSAGGPE